MGKIVYYVAMTIDGYITGPDEDISQFIWEGDGVNAYKEDLQSFKTVIMGRKTYEIGYQFGLKPGQAAYPHMHHHIFSNNLNFDNPSDQVSVEPLSVERVNAIKAEASGDIFMCGGGEFAGWLLDKDLIDVLKIKLNPIVVGDGIHLFGSSKSKIQWKHTNTNTYEDGMVVLSYERTA